MADSAISSSGQPDSRKNAALASLALGLIIALAANLTYAVPKGPVTIGLGLVAPLVLPVVLHLRTTFTADNWKHRLLRELATLVVAAPAAAVSYVHTYELVLSAGEPWILAVLAPLSSDGLAGMATLALYRLRQPAVEVRAARKPPRAERPAPTVADRVAETTPTAAQPERKPAVKPDGETATEWARREWPCTAKEIQLGTGVAKGSSYRIYNALLAEMEAS